MVEGEMNPSKLSSDLHPPAVGSLLSETWELDTGTSEIFLSDSTLQRLEETQVIQQIALTARRWKAMRIGKVLKVEINMMVVLLISTGEAEAEGLRVQGQSGLHT